LSGALGDGSPGDLISAAGVSTVVEAVNLTGVGDQVEAVIGADTNGTVNVSPPRGLLVGEDTDLEGVTAGGHTVNSVKTVAGIRVLSGVLVLVSGSPLNLLRSSRTFRIKSTIAFPVVDVNVRVSPRLATSVIADGGVRELSIVEGSANPVLASG
jgi:hypothetical protein